MNFEKELFRISKSLFSLEFEITKFKESPTWMDEIDFRTAKGVYVYLSVQGKGELLENKDFVVLRVVICFDTGVEYFEDLEPPTVICNCDVNILDVAGHERFPRCIMFEHALLKNSKYSHLYEERYIERSCILNDAPEYLQDDTLTVIVEGSVEEWDEYNLPGISHWLPSRYTRRFHVEELEHDLKVYLPQNSVHTRSLLRHSKFFRRMLTAPMRESTEKRILLKNEELPAFLCMLLFIETENLVLYEATILDVYKMADLYDIPRVLEKCRKYMEKYLPKSVMAVLEFATYYNDSELKRTVESYIERDYHEPREPTADVEVGNGVDDFICDTLPVSSNLIHTKEDFERHLRNLWKRVSSEMSHEVVDYIPEREREAEKFSFYQ